MAQETAFLSTGLTALDGVLRGLRAGDNVVFQVDSVADYKPFVAPLVESALRAHRRLIYFRFAKHPPLVPEGCGADVHVLQPEEGFETFVTRIHDVLDKDGHRAFCIFDALSELSLKLYSDRMLGNFYLVTCPHLYALQSVAYYALLKNYHSFYASSPIHETAQIIVDVYRHKGRLYIHPRKVLHRYAPTMHMLHVWEGDEIRPVGESSTTTEVLTSASWSGLTFMPERPGSWTRTFLEAEETLQAFKRGQATAGQIEAALHLTVKSAITREERTRDLVEKYLELGDVLDIQKRMVSSGNIGGKAAGMLLARAVLRKTDPKWQDLLESHDSFFIGSEAYYSFLVENGCWRFRRAQKKPETLLDGAQEARERLLAGNFTDRMKERFARMLDYFGQAPIIVRSSSLLEDNFQSAFAGKYESVFCANQGPRNVRLEDFLFAVRRIYASSMSEEALAYRKERNLLDRDEQMALLVQRVSGIQYGRLFFPQLSGVGFSYNPYCWSREIDPTAGMLRLVFGLGTRAVERNDDDYTRVVALNAPSLRPEGSFDDVRRYAQRRVDVLDLEANLLMSYDFPDVARRCAGLPMETFASRNEALARMAEERGTEAFPWVLTFDGLLNETNFAADMREMLAVLQDAYDSPVDIEFTVNFLPERAYKINLLQCRPLPIRDNGSTPVESGDAQPEGVVLQAEGVVIGPGRTLDLDRLVYVIPERYAALSNQKRHELANVIGRLCHHDAGDSRKKVMLIGPGRWGTAMPALGVPIRFAQIQPISVLCEIVAMSEDLIPDLSLGTHFFSDLIETDILYVAMFPNRAGNGLDRKFFEGAPNGLCRLLPGAEEWSDVVRVIDAADVGPVRLRADTREQRLTCRRA